MTKKVLQSLIPTSMRAAQFIVETTNELRRTTKASEANVSADTTFAPLNYRITLIPGRFVVGGYSATVVLSGGSRFLRWLTAKWVVLFTRKDRSGKMMVRAQTNTRGIPTATEMSWATSLTPEV